MIATVSAMILWYAYNIIFEARIPLRHDDITYADQPEAFGWSVAAMVILPVLAIAVSAIWIARDRRDQDILINRRANQPLDKAVRRTYQDFMTSSRPLIIAVDGPAASGKGTIASRLAQIYGLPFLDTGLLYRAVGMGVLSAGADLSDEAVAERVARALDADGLSDDPRLTTGEAGEAASRVAGYPGVRAALLELQQAFASQPGGAVLDGRDIGTVIAPNALAKLFVTATPEVRARRRWKQLHDRGDAITYEAMLADIQRRDERDAGRGAAPMVQAPDAVLLDTTEMDIETSFDAARRIVEAARARHTL